ncbi:MAG: hypothetical protein P4L27_15065 [Ignavibacteriaceae bacterium]|nr:hypothetical protein [Ignavibacteriaceae bacterium]
MTTKPEPKCHEFCVDDTPYCVYDSGIRDINEEYLNSINPKFYEFIAQQNSNILKNNNAEKESKQFAAILLRNYYSQALETLFALIFATLQSPNSVLVWMLRYSNYDLYNLVKKVNENQSIKIRFIINEKFSWESVIRIIFDGTPGSETKEEVIKNFTGLLSSFANDYLDQNIRSEYNSVKHGFRVRPGGFSATMKSPETGKDIPLSQSEFGSMFYTEENIKGEKNQYTLRSHALNWNPENNFYGIHFVSLLINNLLLYLKRLNNIKTDGLIYKTVSKEQVNLPWGKMSGSASFSIGFSMKVELIDPINKDEILSMYHDTNTKDLQTDIHK